MSSTENRALQLSTIIACLGLIIAILMSLNLWMPNRFFPLTPMIPGFPALPAVLAPLVPIIIVLCAGKNIATPSKWLLLAIFSLLSISILQDIMRFQPFIYMYGFMILAGLYAALHKNEEEHVNRSIIALKIMVVGIYFWAGAQKLNYVFFDHVFPWFMSPIIEPHLYMGTVFEPLLYIVPFLEIAIAVCFLHPKTVNAGFALATGMLLMVLICLGPLGHNWNYIVLPWNIALFALDIVLFKKVHHAPRELLTPKSVLHGVSILLFIALPALSYINKWHAYPSFQLYSGNIEEGYIQGTNETKQSIPYFKDIATGNQIWFQMWSNHDVGVVVYPHRSVFYNAAKSICDRISEEEQQKLTLVIHGKPNIWTGKYDIEKTKPCLSPDQKQVQKN